MSEPAVNAAAKALLDEPLIANLATVGRDGTPHLTPVWVDRVGNDVVINTAEGRTKVNNLKRQAKVAVSVVDPKTPTGSWPCRAPSPPSPTTTPTPTSTASPASTSASTPTRCASPASAASRSPSGPTGSSCNPPTPDRTTSSTRSRRFHHE